MKRKLFISLVTIMCSLVIAFSSVSVFAENDIIISATGGITLPPPPTTVEDKEDEEKEDADKENTNTGASNSSVNNGNNGNSGNGNNGGSNSGNGNDNNNANTGANRVTTTRRQTTTEDFTEQELPEGSFFVYVEKNNGEPRLKRVMSEPGIVPEPNEPTRQGYVFQGWYADAKFKKPWNFFVDYADRSTVIYAKWAADENTVEYKVAVNPADGGKLEVNPGTATADEYVVITVTPDTGKRLVAGSLTVNGVPTDVLSFLMPAKNVVIEAKFEDIPTVVEEKDIKDYIPFIIGGAVLLLVVIIVTIILFVRRKSYEFSDDQIDENGTIIDDEDDDWYDESITVEDGFKEGERVIGNYSPEPDNEYADLDDMQ